MPPSGSDVPLIYCLGEAPGEVEDEEGRQFVGPSGDYLRPFFPNRLRSKIRWNNVLSCRPPNNRDPDKVEIECCRPRVESDIEYTRPDAIFGFGAVPLSWADKVGGISLWRGRSFPIRIGDHVCWYYPLQHPAFFLHTRRGNWESDEEVAFKIDIARAIGEVENGLPEPVVHSPEFAKKDVTCITGRSGKDLDFVLDFLDYAGAQHAVGVDNETQNLRPYRKDSVILTRAVSVGDETVAFAWRHKESGWSDDAFAQLEKGWLRFLRSKAKKAVHNAAFEMEWDCYFYGLDLARGVPWEDTETQAFVLDERVGEHKPGALALEFISLQNFGINIKRLSPGFNKNHMAKEPLSALLPYNGIDAKYHLFNYAVQDERIRKEGLEAVYQEKLRQLPTVVLTQIKGLPVNVSVTYRLEQEYIERIDKALLDIQALDEVSQYKRITGRVFNPGSPQDVTVMLRDVLKTRAGQDEDGGWSTSKDVLSKVESSVASGIIGYRELVKLKGTYVDPMLPGAPTLYDGNILHTNLNTCFAETGRLCVAADTVLPTNMGNIEISKLDLTATHKNVLIKTHTGEWQRIDALIFKGSERMWRFQFDNGSYIDCTERHRLFTPDGWQLAGSLSAGDAAWSYQGAFRGRENVSTKKSFWCRQDSGCVGRTLVRRAFSFVQYSGSYLEKTDGRQSKFISTIKVLVPKLLRRCSILCQNIMLFPIENGQPVWSSGAVKDFGSAGSREFGASWGYDPQYVQAAWSECAPNEEKFGLSWVRKPLGAAYALFSTIRGRLVSHGSCCAWGQGCDDSVQFSQKPRGGGYFVIQGILPFNRFSRVGKEYGSKRLKEKSQGAGYMLVSELWGNVCSAVSNGCRYKTSASVDVQKNSSKFVERGFLSTGTSGRYRSGWAISRKNGRAGSSEGTVIDRVGAVGDPYLGCPSSEIDGKGDYNGFTVTRFVGRASIGVQDVWDISVSGDHSYVAHGLIHHNSSDDPNLQNIPIRTKEGRRVRRQFASKVVASFDYGQIDARIIACGSRDASFCKALFENYDIHAEWARRLVLAYPSFIGGKKFLDDKAVFGAFRNKIKSVWVFALFYGAALRTTAGRLGADEDVLRPLYELFWHTFDGVKKWQDVLVKQFEELGYVQMLGGLRRRAPLGRGQTINSPVQGATNRIVMHAMNRLSETGDPLLQANIQIHDDLKFHFDRERDYEDSAPRIIDIMLDGSAFDWFCVPLVVEMKEGPNWEDLEEVGVFDSCKHLGWPARSKEFL